VHLTQELVRHEIQRNMKIPSRGDKNQKAETGGKRWFLRRRSWDQTPKEPQRDKHICALSEVSSHITSRHHTFNHLPKPPLSVLDHL
jgi:hypothetical protein